MPLKTTAGNHGEAAKGCGATINPEGRFERCSRDGVDDGWFQEPDEDASRPKTVIAIERAKSVISRNDSPDIGFSQSLLITSADHRFLSDRGWKHVTRQSPSATSHACEQALGYGRIRGGPGGE